MTADISSNLSKINSINRFSAVPIADKKNHVDSIRFTLDDKNAKTFYQFIQHRHFASDMSRIKIEFRIGDSLHIFSSRFIMFLLQRCSHLKELNLKFLRHINFNNQTLVDLANNIGRMSDLEKIKLDFSFCFKLTNQGLEKLFRALSKCNKLKSLSLDFTYCKNLDSDRMKVSLATSIRHLNNLEHLAIRYKNPPSSSAGKNTSDSINKTLQILPRASLRTLCINIENFNFNHCLLESVSNLLKVCKSTSVKLELSYNSRADVDPDSFLRRVNEKFKDRSSFESKDLSLVFFNRKLELYLNSEGALQCYPHLL